MYRGVDMKALKMLSLNDRKDKYFLFLVRYSVSTFLIFALAFILLKFPLYSIEGVKKGISICMESLIPSLYPFMILTNMYASSGAAERKIPLADKLCQFLFGLPGSCAAVIMFSLVGGLPIGAEMSSELYSRGVISAQQYRRMLCFCVNPGPAFVISAVGLTMLGSEKAGVLIFMSLVLSSLIIGVVSRFFSVENESCSNNGTNIKMADTKGTLIEKAVVKSSKSILMISAWVVAFSCLTELAANLGIPDGMKTFFICTAEMTKGSMIAAQSFPIPIVAAVIGFSGICGHFQLMGALNRAGLKYKYFLVGRIANSGLSAVICSLLLRAFPVARETFSVGIKPEGRDTSGSIVLSVLMIVMAVLFVMGDDYIINRGNHKKV